MNRTFYLQPLQVLRNHIFLTIDMNMDMHMPTESPSSSESISMPMVFTTSFSGVPILFQTLQPTTGGQLFAVWIAIFATAIFYRSLGCLKNRLEATLWSPRCHYEGGLLEQKGRYIQPFSIMRDGGRALLAFVTATLGYALMLVVMSFIVVCGV